MQLYNDTGLRDSLNRLETEKLDRMLQAELEKQLPDVNTVRLITGILEERDSSPPSLTEEDRAAWLRYRGRMAGLRKKPSPVRKWLVAAASLALAVGLLFAVVPQQAEAETFWEMLQRWSSTVLTYLSREDKFGELNYTFETDNSGLQQVYDKVVELGVTEPMVPMWLPEGYELTKLESQSTPMRHSIGAWFDDEDKQLVFRINVYEGKPAHQFYRDEAHYEEYERNGVTHYITQNNGWWLVIWTKENKECLLTADCHEDTLRRILESIYVMEAQ